LTINEEKNDLFDCIFPTHGSNQIRSLLPFFFVGGQNTEDIRMGSGWKKIGLGNKEVWVEFSVLNNIRVPSGAPPRAGNL